MTVRLPLSLLLLLSCTASPPPAEPPGLRIRAGARQDLSAAELDAIVLAARGASDMLWRMTGGGMRIASFTIEDASGERSFPIGFDRDATSPPWSPTRLGPPAWTNAYAILHEICHVEFGLVDEYPKFDGDRPTCAACIMGGSAGRESFCDASNHAGPGKSCREILASRFPRLAKTFAAMGSECPPPEPRIVIHNNGR